MQLYNDRCHLYVPQMYSCLKAASGRVDEIHVRQYLVRIILFYDHVFSIFKQFWIVLARLWTSASETQIRFEAQCVAGDG